MQKSPSPYEVWLQDYFYVSYKKLVKKHYSKSQSKHKEGFDNLLETLYDLLAINPRMKAPRAKQITNKVYRIITEVWPDKTHIEGWEFWKLYFYCPKLSGAAQEGRLMYLIHLETKQVQPFFIYTKAQHKKRPPEKEVAFAINSTIKKA